MIDWNDDISDELLAAYLDGNTTPEENFRVEAAIYTDSSLQELTDIVSDSYGLQEQVDMRSGDYGYWELGIDPVFSSDELNAMTTDVFDSTDNGLPDWNTYGDNEMQSINNEEVFGDDWGDSSDYDDPSETSGQIDLND